MVNAKTSVNTFCKHEENASQIFFFLFVICSKKFVRKHRNAFSTFWLFSLSLS